MNTPNPLVPQGTMPPGRKSTVRVAILTIVAIHAVLLSGILMQSGCKREEPEKKTEITTDPPRVHEDVARLETNRFYEPLPDTLAGGLAAPETNASVGGFGSAPIPAPTTNPFVPVTPSVAWNTPPAPAAGETKDHTIVKGDILARIARTHRVTVGQIREANPGLDPNRLKIGQSIKIPVAAPVSSGGLGLAEPAAAPSDGASYVVKKGDTLTRIAGQHGVTVAALKAANQLKSDRIHVDQKLAIPVKPAQP